MFAAEAKGKLKPGTARKWAHETKDIKGLPEHIKKAFMVGVVSELEKHAASFGGEDFINRRYSATTHTFDFDVAGYRKLVKRHAKKGIVHGFIVNPSHEDAARLWGKKSGAAGNNDAVFIWEDERPKAFKKLLKKHLNKNYLNSAKKHTRSYLYAFREPTVTKLASTPAWTRSEGKDPQGGLNRKGVASYRAANPGSKLQMAVTKDPSKLKEGSKDWKRRKSFCARMGGMPGAMKDDKGRPTRKALALKKWNC